MGEILNAIESPLRSRGTIVTFSSNMEREIDPALLRPGRIDKIIRLPNATYNQVLRLFMFHFPSETKKASKFAKLAIRPQNKKKPSMAEIRGCLMHETVSDAFKSLNSLLN